MSIKYLILSPSQEMGGLEEMENIKGHQPEISPGKSSAPQLGLPYSAVNMLELGRGLHVPWLTVNHGTLPWLRDFST